MYAIATRRRSQPPPSWVVWEALMKPNRDPQRQWLTLRRGEVAPRVMESTRPGLVVWSSIWAAHPDDLIRFDIHSTGQETDLRWTLLAPQEAPPDVVVPRRKRLNELINAQLRFSFGQ
jgi:hypothetical protein